MQSQALKLGQKLMKRCQELGLSVKDFMRIGEEAYKALQENESVYCMTEEEIENRIRILGIDRPELKIFGVGWNGFNVCHYLKEANIVLDPKDADFLLIPIIENEKARDEYEIIFNKKPFFALIDQSEPWKCTSKVTASFEAFKNPDFGHCIELADHQIEGRIVFPWERVQMKETAMEPASERNLLHIYNMIARLAAIIGICLPEDAVNAGLLKELETVQTWATRLLNEGTKQ